MRLAPLLLVLVAAASGCGAASPAEARVERCVDRLLASAAAGDDAARRYVRDTYCARFEGRGWVYEDGALSIEAQLWLDEGATCATARAGEPATTVPCDVVEGPGARRLDCALLRHVRQAEVAAYVERLRRKGAVECADGTPLAGLGVR